MQSDVIVLHGPYCSRGDDGHCAFDDLYPRRGLSYFHGRGRDLILCFLPFSCRRIRVRKTVDLQGNLVYLFSVLHHVLGIHSSGRYHDGGRGVRADLHCHLSSAGGHYRRVRV